MEVGGNLSSRASFFLRDDLLHEKHFFLFLYLKKRECLISFAFIKKRGGHEIIIFLVSTLIYSHLVRIIYISVGIVSIATLEDGFNILGGDLDSWKRVILSCVTLTRDLSYLEDMWIFGYIAYIYITNSYHYYMCHDIVTCRIN